jgi:hypothetical protein
MNFIEMGPIPVAAGSRRGCTAARFLGLRVPNSQEEWKSVSLECCVLGRGLCDGPMIRLEESYRVCVCLTERNRGTSTMRGPGPTRTVELYKKS